MVDAAVEEVIRKLVTNPKFEQAIRQKIGSRIDTEELETELEQLRKKLHQLNGAKAKLGQQMDSLDVTDKHYDRKYQDMEERLYKLYDDIDSVEEEIEEVETRIYNVRQQKISGDNIYQFLLYFDKLYDKFTDAEKKEFLSSFVERVDIYEQEQPDGRFLKHIKFRFPVYFNGKEIEEMSWDNETTVETVALLTKKSDFGKKKRDFQVEMEVPISPDMHQEYKEQKPTYENIKKYIMEKHGVNVHTAYIAEVKRDCELDMRPNYNVSKKEAPEIKSCTPEKREYIMEALRYYKLVV